MSVEGRRRLLPEAISAVLLGLGAFILYLTTLAPTVLPGDGGEFQFVPYLLGVAHPTGYPLYCLLGWIWSHLLPLGDAAYRMNIFSAMWAALAAAFLFLTARRFLELSLPGLAWPVGLVVAALASATMAVTPTFWSQSIIAEVYSLHIFLVVLLLYFLLASGTKRGANDVLPLGYQGAFSPVTADGRARKRSLLLAACCFGLGLAHHSTIVLLVPAIAITVWLLDRRLLSDWRLVLRGALLIILPLALYLYIPWRAPHTPYLKLPLTSGRDLVLYENRVSDLLQFVMGGPFGSSVDLGVDLGERLSMAWGFVRSEIPWPGLLLAVIGLATLIARRRWPLLALTALAFVATVAFNLVYTIGDIYVLYLPVYLILVLWLSLGAGSLIEILSKAWAGFTGRHPRGRASTESPSKLASLAWLGAVIPVFALPVWMATSRFGELDMSHNTSARDRWDVILAQPLPAGAVLVSDDRDDIMPMWYLQYVGDGQEPVRPDLLGLFPQITAEYPTLGQVLDLALDSGRPVYLIKPMPGIEVKVDVVREGILERVAGPAATNDPQYARAEDLGGALLLFGYARSPHSPRPGERLEVTLYWEARRALETRYHSYVHLLDEAGLSIAQSDHQPGGAFYPTSLWQPGERLRDEHVLSIPADTPPGVYRLSAGMYSLSPDGQPLSLGKAITVGLVGIKDDVQADAGLISHAVMVDFGGIELVGFDAAPQASGLLVSLDWRCVLLPDQDYTVFIHLLNARGEQIAQQDGQPQDGAYPTSVWDAGEVIRDEHTVPIGGALLKGDYVLRVGLYLLETGERLPVVGCERQDVHCGPDFVELGPVTLSD